MSLINKSNSWVNSNKSYRASSDMFYIKYVTGTTGTAAGVAIGPTETRAPTDQ